MNKERTCPNCGKEFICTPKQHAKIFCSQMCKWTHDNKNRILKPNTFYTCIICGKDVEKYLEPSKRSTSALKYCSQKCHGIGARGEGHPMWGGKNKPRDKYNKKTTSSEREYPISSDHPMWSGGRRVNDQGYIFVYCPDHPRANKRRKTVREHILVMEKHIGRYLLPGEVVHHENEINDDNRIENLRLFSSQSDHKKYHDQYRTKNNLGQYEKRGKND